MLPAASRVRTPAEHRLVARRGRRGAAGPLSVRVLIGEPTRAARAGVVVPKSVGNAVARNRVKRRLRHALAARIVDLSWGTALVVHAGAGATALSSAELAEDLGRALDKALSKAPAAPGRVATR